MCLALGAARWWRRSLRPTEQSPGTREAGELAKGGVSLGPSADGREETGTFGECTTAQSQARAPDSAPDSGPPSPMSSTQALGLGAPQGGGPAG